MVGCDLSGGLGSGAASLTVGYPAQAVSPQGSHRSTYEDGRGFFHCTFDFGVEAFAFRKPSKVGSPFMIMEALYVLHKRMSVGHGIPVPPQRTPAPPSCPKKDVSDTGIWLQVRQGALPNGKRNRPLEENWTMGIIPARGLSVAGFCPIHSTAREWFRSFWCSVYLQKVSDKKSLSGCPWKYNRQLRTATAYACVLHRNRRPARRHHHSHNTITAGDGVPANNTITDHSLWKTGNWKQTIELQGV